MDYLFNNAHVWMAAAGIAAGIAVTRLVRQLRRRQRQRALALRLLAQTPGVCYLHTFPRTNSQLHTGTPALIAETFLRAAGIPYVLLPTLNIGVSPTERLPYLELDQTGTTDSYYIIERIQRDFPAKCAANLEPLTSPTHQAILTMLRRTLAHSLRYGQYRVTFVDNPEYILKKMGPMFPKFLPTWVKRKIVGKLRQRQITMLNMEGYGDLSNEEYKAELRRDLKVIETLLSSALENGQPYLFTTTKPSVADVIVWSYMSQIAEVPFAEVEAARRHPIQGYVRRLEALWFPDAEELKKKYGCVTSGAQDFTSPIPRRS